MKLFISFFLLILSCTTVPAQDKQDTPDSLDIVYKQIRNIIPSATIYYLDKPWKGASQRHITAVDHPIVKSISALYPNSIHLTGAERAYLSSQLKKAATRIWPDNLFPNSKRISLDSAENHQHQIIEKVVKLRDLIKDKDSLIAFAKKYRGCNAVFFFTKPIYMRNHSIFLQYFNWYDGGGAESLYFYRKENNEWKKWILVSAGDW